MSEGSKMDHPQEVDVKDAIRRAKTQVADLLEGETYSQLGLEEVKYDDRNQQWVITLGLNRPWNVEKQSTAGPVRLAFIDHQASSYIQESSHRQQNRRTRFDGRH
jgi:hypothetical protein